MNRFTWIWKSNVSAESARGEVRERAHEVERAMEAHLPHELDHFVVAHADAVHTRVHRQVIRRAHADASAPRRTGWANSEV